MQKCKIDDFEINNTVGRIVQDIELPFIAVIDNVQDGFSIL